MPKSQLLLLLYALALVPLIFVALALFGPWAAIGLAVFDIIVCLAGMHYASK